MDGASEALVFTTGLAGEEEIPEALCSFDDEPIGRPWGEVSAEELDQERPMNADLFVKNEEGNRNSGKAVAGLEIGDLDPPTVVDGAVCAVLIVDEETTAATLEETVDSREAAAGNTDLAGARAAETKALDVEG